MCVRIRIVILFFVVLPLTVGAQVYEGVAGWRYIPLDTAFWEKIEDARQRKDLFSLIALADSQQKKAKSELERAEAQYAFSLACMELGFSYCAYDYALSVLKNSPGSMPAMASLFILESLIQKEVVIEDEIQRLLNVSNFRDVPVDLMSMVSFYVLRDNLNRSLKEWQSDSQKKILQGSYWQSRLDFFQSLLLVQSGKLAAAEKNMGEIEKAVGKYPKLQQTIRLQRARLLYTLGEFQEADTVYGALVSEGRELGKILLERAWLKYFQKDYSLSLGMLESLKAPYFRSATNPEQYILAMVAFRDLCHYDAVKSTYKEFELVYKPWIEHLKDQKPLFENRALLSMVLAQAQNLRLGNMIGLIRSENERIKETKLPPTLKEGLKTLYEVGESRWKDYASQALANDLKAASQEFLDYVEQARLLEYLSGLDRFRLKGRFEDRTYRAPEANTYAIHQLFWPLSGEFWWDEMSSYRVLASDRCGGGI